MNESVHRKVTEAAKWLSDQKTDATVSDKAYLCRNLLHTNGILVSKLDKLKLLLEKKNAQYETTKAVVDLERELYDADLQNIIRTASESLLSSATVDDDDDSAAQNIRARLGKMAQTQERQTFYANALSICTELLTPVKRLATDGIVTEDVMQCCFEIFSQENPKVLFVPPSVVRSILISKNATIVFDNLTSLKANEYDACFFALCEENKEENVHQWSLVLYVKNPAGEGALYLYNSRPDRNREIDRKFLSLVSVYFNTQTFYEVRCTLQTAKDESGYHVIENVTKLLPMLETGRIIVDGVEVTLDNINILRVFTLKCRILVMKLYLQRKLQLMQAHFDKLAE